MNSPFGSPAGSVTGLLTSVVSSGTGSNGSQAGQGSGWLYDLLLHAGLSPSTAHTVTVLILRPVELALVILVAVLVAHYGAKAIRRGLLRIGHPAADRMRSPRATARINTVVALVANIWRFVVVLIAIGVVLTIFGINLTPLLASATIIGATIGFGAQSLVRDYLSGVLLTVEDQFGIGDAISVNETTGVVEDVSLRVTRVRSGDGTLWHLPNGDIRRLGNTSRGEIEAVVDLPVAVHRSADLDRAREILLSSAREQVGRAGLAEVCPSGPELVGVVDAGTGTCTLRVSIRTTSGHQGTVEAAVREAGVRRLIDAELWPVPGEPAAS